MTAHPTHANYDEAQAYQLREWCEGRPWHNPWSPGATAPGALDNRKEGECCPDFSCCMPEHIWARERRYAFLAADDEGRYRMLVGALLNLAGPDDVNVVAGAAWGEKP